MWYSELFKNALGNKSLDTPAKLSTLSRYFTTQFASNFNLEIQLIGIFDFLKGFPNGAALPESLALQRTLNTSMTNANRFGNKIIDTNTEDTIVSIFVKSLQLSELQELSGLIDARLQDTKVSDKYKQFMIRLNQKILDSVSALTQAGSTRARTIDDDLPPVLSANQAASAARSATSARVVAPATQAAGVLFRKKIETTFHTDYASITKENIDAIHSLVTRLNIVVMGLKKDDQVPNLANIKGIFSRIYAITKDIKFDSKNQKLVPSEQQCHEIGNLMKLFIASGGKDAILSAFTKQLGKSYSDQMQSQFTEFENLFRSESALKSSSTPLRSTRG